MTRYQIHRNKPATPLKVEGDWLENSLYVDPGTPYYVDGLGVMLATDPSGNEIYHCEQITLQHVMIDIETLGNGPDAYIAQIAAVRFCPLLKWMSTTEGAFNRHITHAPQVGAKLDVDTVMFWMRQNKLVQERVFGADTQRYALANTLYGLSAWLGTDAILWAKPASFDLLNLRLAYGRNNINAPWGFRQERCLRTLAKCTPNIEEPEFVGQQHDAQDDAFHQAAHAIELLG